MMEFAWNMVHAGNGTRIQYVWFMVLSRNASISVVRGSQRCYRTCLDAAVGISHTAPQ